MLTPAFHFGIVNDFFDTMDEESNQLVDLLKKNVDKNFNIVPIAAQFALNLICGESIDKY